MQNPACRLIFFFFLIPPLFVSIEFILGTLLLWEIIKLSVVLLLLKWCQSI